MKVNDSRYDGNNIVNAKNERIEKGEGGVNETSGYGRRSYY